MAVPKVLPTRRLVQCLATALTIGAGVQFTLWVMSHLRGQWPTVPRPPSVEAFLPIGSMLGFRHLLHTGSIDPVHPAGLAIFLGICLMSAVLARSFCSHICPFGLLSELLGRLGVRRLGKTLSQGCQVRSSGVVTRNCGSADLALTSKDTRVGVIQCRVIASSDKPAFDLVPNEMAIVSSLDRRPSPGLRAPLRRGRRCRRRT